MRIGRKFVPALLILLFTVLGFLVMGYHPGAEDDAVYLTSVKAELNPALFPHDADFFQLQMRNSTFDKWMSSFVRATGVPVAWAELFAQLLSIYLILWACWCIASQLFEKSVARWAAVATVSAMFTLPVAGTELFIVDQYLHPRAPATTMILFCVSSVLSGRRLQSIFFSAAALLFHPLMGIFGISFGCILALTVSRLSNSPFNQLRERWIGHKARSAAAVIPFAWTLGHPSPAWLEALCARPAYRLYQWQWYEWLGAIGPLLIFWQIAGIARKRGQAKLSSLATAIVYYGLFQMVFAMVIESPAAPIGLSTLEPMRYLHLIYVFLALIAGGYLGSYVLKTRPWRWGVFVIVANGGMFIAQRQLFASSAHIELPSAATPNPWLQTFDWVRKNTPDNAYFALGPAYMSAPGEDYHSFRAVAERSQLADSVKDTSVVTKVPALAPAWKRQIEAQKNWDHFKLADFERLKAQFGVDWVIVRYPEVTGLDCRWHNDSLAACRVP